MSGPVSDAAARHGGDAPGRAEILARVRSALAAREAVDHPGDFGGWRPAAGAADGEDAVGAAARLHGAGASGAHAPRSGRDATDADGDGDPRHSGGGSPAFEGSSSGTAPSPLDRFTALFEAAGGRVVRAASETEAAAWLAERIAQAGGEASFGTTLPPNLRPSGAREARPDAAPVGASFARAAVAETGSLLLDARDGRRAQLLPPEHLVLVRAESVADTLVEALAGVATDLPSAIGLHSGPSKSADIGQILVTGVHGPGRVTAVVIG